jgi:hypothetical protein
MPHGALSRESPGGRSARPSLDRGSASDLSRTARRTGPRMRQGGTPTSSRRSPTPPTSGTRSCWTGSAEASTPKHSTQPRSTGSSQASPTCRGDVRPHGHRQSHDSKPDQEPTRGDTPLASLAELGKPSAGARPNDTKRAGRAARYRLRVHAAAHTDPGSTTLDRRSACVLPTA